MSGGERERGREGERRGERGCDGGRLLRVHARVGAGMTPGMSTHAFACTCCSWLRVFAHPQQARGARAREEHLCVHARGGGFPMHVNMFKRIQAGTYVHTETHTQRHTHTHTHDIHTTANTGEAILLSPVAALLPCASYRGLQGFAPPAPAPAPALAELACARTGLLTL